MRTVTVSNIDGIKPVVKISNSKGKVTVTVTDSNLSAKSAKRGRNSVKWPSNNIFTAKGSYLITATDKAGNISTASFTIK